MTEVRSNFSAEIARQHSKLVAMRYIMVQLAVRLLGADAIKYRNPEDGMSLESGFDCSGFVCALVNYSAEACGVDLLIPRHANEQWRVFGEPVDYSQRRTGDLVYFPSRRKNTMRVIGHVGIVLDKNRYIHSPGMDKTLVTIAALPKRQAGLDNVRPGDIYTQSPAGIKRLSLPIGSGRWHAR